jgi:hypothetical protein
VRRGAGVGAPTPRVASALTALLSALALPTPVGAQTFGDTSVIVWRLERATESGASVRGVVFDSRLEPVSEAQVFLEGTAIGSLTDGAGRFELRRWEPGPYDLIVRAYGHGDGSARIVVPRNGTVFAFAVLSDRPILLCDVFKPEPATDDLALVVTDASTHQPPYTDVTVILTHASGVRQRTYTADEVRRAPHGIGIGEAVGTKGLHTIEVRAQGYEPWRAENVFLESSGCGLTLYGREHRARLQPLPDP